MYFIRTKYNGINSNSNRNSGNIGLEHEFLVPKNKSTELDEKQNKTLKKKVHKKIMSMKCVHVHINFVVKYYFNFCVFPLRFNPSS